MANSEHKSDRAKLLEELSAALFELRDALMELSLSLQDWQFETDLEQRTNLEDMVQKLLHQMTSVQGPSS